MHSHSKKKNNKKHTHTKKHPKTQNTPTSHPTPQENTNPYGIGDNSHFSACCVQVRLCAPQTPGTPIGKVSGKGCGRFSACEDFIGPPLAMPHRNSNSQAQKEECLMPQRKQLRAIAAKPLLEGYHYSIGKGSRCGQGVTFGAGPVSGFDQGLVSPLCLASGCLFQH